MSKEAFVFEVSKDSFEKYVMLNSHKIPVLVEFMSAESGPSYIMADLFSGLAKEFAEQFIFAKVDVYEQPELREEYDIQNIPTTIVFKDGKPARVEQGQLQEAEARSLLRDFGVFRESDEMREQARALHMSGNTPAAMGLLAEAAKKDPANVRIALDIVQIFLDLGEVDQAEGMFARIPDDAKETGMGKALAGQLTFAGMTKDLDDMETLQQRVEQDGDLSARYDMAIRLIAQYQVEAAMEQLFAVHAEDPEFKEGAAREMIANVSNMVAPINSDMAAEYRRRLANMSH